MIFGVCDGLAERFQIEAIWFRLGFVLAFLLYGVGVILYLILAVLMHFERNRKLADDDDIDTADKL